MLSFAKKLSKRGSEREENTQNQTENAKTDIQDDSSSTSQHCLLPEENELTRMKMRHQAFLDQLLQEWHKYGCLQCKS